MRAAALVFAVIACSGCGLTTHVRPTPKGAIEVEGNVGGPIALLGAPIPLPLSTVGASYGVTGAIDVQAHAHLTTLALKTFGFDGGASWLVLPQTRAPAVTLTGRVYAFTDFRSALWTYEELAATASYRIAQWLPRTDAPLLPYASLSAVLTWDGHLALAPAVGVRSEVGAWAFQLDARWLDPFYDASVAPFLSAGGRGVFGVTLGVGYTFGKPKPLGTPTPPVPASPAG